MERIILSNNSIDLVPWDSLKTCTSLTTVDFGNNKLRGAFPDSSIWTALQNTLTILALQGNQLSGSVPTKLFELAYFRNYPFTALNVGDNHLSGPLPTHMTIRDVTFKLVDFFSELWLQGNDWNGGPCVALCGANTGPMDDTKRTSSKIWANKCLEDTDSHKDLLDSEYSIDELGRCTFKSPTCANANKYVASRSIVNSDCRRCPVHTFQPKSDHKETVCYNQPTCNPGQAISKDNDDLRAETRTCNACATNTYQSAEKHRLTECIAQPFCTPGQYITEDSKTARRVCTACPAGHFQELSNHRETKCKPHPSCPAGTEFEITFTEIRKCRECGDNTYQDSENDDALQTVCIEQPTCFAGERITADFKTSRRKCIACDPDEYQDQTKHREPSCIPQPTCNAGEKFEISVTKKRQCSSCDANEYQDASNGGAVEVTCSAQPTCSAGEYISPDSAISRRFCTACTPGNFQDATNHRELDCKSQPVCKAGTAFTSKVTEKRACKPCSSNTYQDNTDRTALQTTCIEQPFCGPGKKMSADTKSERRRCSDCEDDTYQDLNEHRSTSCKPQQPCGAGTLYDATVFEERLCNECPINTYQDTSAHTETTCKPQNTCPAQYAFVDGSITTQGQCVSCESGKYQPQVDHFNRFCFDDPSGQITSCNDAGELNSDSKCECNPGFAGPQCEFSNEETCNGVGNVNYNVKTYSASCNNCNDPAVGVGEWCQFSNTKTCKDFGIVSDDGTCIWNSDVFGTPVVSECRPGYYYNPTPGTPDNDEKEDAIEVGTDNCYPCSPGEFASNAARRVQCDACPPATVDTDDGTFLDMLQTSEPASTSSSDCFAKFQSAPADRQFCYGEGSITSNDGRNAEPKPLGRITTIEDCSSSATSLGLAFEGKFVLPYPGCVYDEMHQKARFYVDQSTYDKDVSMAFNDYNANDNDKTNGKNDDSRRRRQEHQQHQQHQRKEHQQREQDQQPQKHGYKKRRRKWVLVPKKDTPLCEVYVCKDPENDVMPLTSDPANADKYPSCKVSDAQIQAAVQEESEKNRKTFVPAMMSIAVATLGGSYAYQYWSARKSARTIDWYDVWMHIHVWLTFLRAIDIQSDFGFYFISLRGAFLEAYGDGNPDTNPYTEPKVAAFLFAAVFFTALGLFLSPFDIWVMGRRTAGDMLSMFSILIVISISLLEDFPQMILVGIYLTTMNAAGIPIDVVAILSLLVSAASLLFSCGTVYTHIQKLREQDPTGWWRIGGTGGDVENARLRAENAALNKQVRNLTQGSARNAVVKKSNPIFNVDVTTIDEYVDVQGALEAQTPESGQGNPEEQLGGFTDTNNDEDLCEFGKQTGKECTRRKSKKSKFCKKHTCKEKRCCRMKSSKDEYCNQHAGTDYL